MAKINNVSTPKSSFMSVQKDTSIILDCMLKNTRLKKLLYYTTPDALKCPSLTEEETISLVERNIKTVPKMYVDSPVLNYVLITFDDFYPNPTNPQFRDNTVFFDIVCHFDQWRLEDIELRPYKIAAEIDSMFNGKHLTGIGTFQFAGAQRVMINNEFGGLTLMFHVIHGGEDKNFNQDQRDLVNPDGEQLFIDDYNESHQDKWIID